MYLPNRANVMNVLFSFIILKEIHISCVNANMPFEVGKFYRTCNDASGSRIRRQGVTENIFIPDSNLSETEEDIHDDGDDEISQFQKDLNLEDMFEDKSDKSDGKGSDSDISESSDDEEDVVSDYAEELSDAEDDPVQEKIQPRKKGKNKQSKNNIKWRKITPAEVDAKFEGPPFPDPLCMILNPGIILICFFGHELIETISEQTDLYSVQTSGKNIQTNNNEIEQFIGILIMMGIVKYPSYRMYWSPETRIPAIADVMSVNRFENLKRYFHIADNSTIPKQGEANFDKLYKVRPMLESLVSKCRDVPQEQYHSIDEQMIPTKGRSSLRQYLPKKPHKWGINCHQGVGKMW